MSRPISRREFLTYAWTTLGLLGWGFLASCRGTPIVSPSLEPSLTPNATSTIKASPTFKSEPSSIPIKTATNTLTPDATPTPTVPKSELIISNPEIIKAYLRDPNFYSTTLGLSGRTILEAQQFNPRQYDRLDKRYKKDLSTIQNNACGLSCLTMVTRIIGYFYSGEVPDITEADVFNQLINQTFTDVYGKIAPYFVPNYTMKASGLKPALEKLVGNLITVNSLTHDWGAYGRWQIIPMNQWSSIFQNELMNVFNEAGMSILEGFKYGNPPGTEPHFVIVTDVNSPNDKDFPNLLIIDPRNGVAKRTPLRNFFEEANPTKYPDLKKQVVFMYSLGIKPNFIAA